MPQRNSSQCFDARAGLWLQTARGAGRHQLTAVHERFLGWARASRTWAGLCSSLPDILLGQRSYQAAAGPRNLIIEGPVILASVLIGSYVAMKIYDEPLRRRLGLAWQRARHSPSLATPKGTSPPV